MEEEDIPIVPRFALLSSVWAGKPWPAARVVNTGERMKGSHRDS